MPEVIAAQGRRRLGPGGQRRLEAGEADPSGAQSDQRVQLGGGVDPADDLGGAPGQLLPLWCQPDAAADALDQPRAGFGLQPGQVVADRGL